MERRWTMDEALDQAQRDWDGPRCEHGFALLPFGPDVWCERCEAEAQAEMEAELELAAMDGRLATGGRMYLLPVGPCRDGTDVMVLLGLRDRVVETESADVPF